MNILLKTFAAFVMVVAGGAAFAQWPPGCLPAAQVQGQPPKCWDGRQLNPHTGQWGWPVQAVQVPQVQHAPQQYVMPQYAAQPYYGGQPNYGGLPPGMIPIQGNPGFFQQGGNIYRCSAVASWGGGLLGAGLGYLIGKNVTISGHRLSGAGAVLGAVAGNQIACELVRPSVPVPVYAPQPQMMAPQPMAQQYAPPMAAHSGPPVPAEQQVGGTVTVSRQVIGREFNCSIGANPELQNLPLDGVKCKALRDAMRVTETGHCIVGGVNHPELVDNEPACLAKQTEVTAQANAKVIAQQQATASQTTGVWGYMPPGASPSNPKTCYVTVPVNGTRPGCSSVVVLSPQTGETRGVWEQRASRGDTFSN